MSTSNEERVNVSVAFQVFLWTENHFLDKFVLKSTIESEVYCSSCFFCLPFHKLCFWILFMQANLFDLYRSWPTLNWKVRWPSPPWTDSASSHVPRSICSAEWPPQTEQKERIISVESIFYCRAFPIYSLWIHNPVTTLRKPPGEWASMRIPEGLGSPRKGESL